MRYIIVGRQHNMRYSGRFVEAVDTVLKAIEYQPKAKNHSGYSDAVQAAVEEWLTDIRNGFPPTRREVERLYTYYRKASADVKKNVYYNDKILNGLMEIGEDLRKYNQDVFTNQDFTAKSGLNFSMVAYMAVCRMADKIEARG
jgi:5'-deoxynucleotidase YfbR-like HD superfamily hydrolase